MTDYTCKRDKSHCLWELLCKLGLKTGIEEKISNPNRFDSNRLRPYSFNMPEKQSNSVKTYWWQSEPAIVTQCRPSLEPGQDCPRCHDGKLFYDALFLLTCSKCNYVVEGGAFT